MEQHLAKHGGGLMERQKRLARGVTVAESIAFHRGQLAWFQEQGYDVHLLASPGRLLAECACREGVTAHPSTPWREAVRW